MALPLIDRLGLNPRERRLLTIMISVVIVLGLLGVPVLLATLVHSRDAENQDLSTAIASVQGARMQVRDRQTKKDAIATRYAKKAPPLAGYLEQTAHQEKLEVTDSVDRAEVPHGKRYAERSTAAHLKKAGMYAIAKFLESLEKSGYPMDVSRLNIRRRVGEPDSYDVEVGISAYDRHDAPLVSPSPSASADESSKEKQP